MGYVKSFKSFNNDAGKAVKTRKIEEQDTGLTLGGDDPQFKNQQDEIRLLRSSINKMENDLVQKKNELNTKVISLENAVKLKEEQIKAEEEAKNAVKTAEPLTAEEQ
jgi:hypothetical protein